MYNAQFQFHGDQNASDKGIVNKSGSRVGLPACCLPLSFLSCRLQPHYILIPHSFHI